MMDRALVLHPAPHDRRVVLISTDGGVYRSNPSYIGGSYAYIKLYADGSIEQTSQAVLPADGTFDPECGRWKMTNNITELAAMCFAIHDLPSGWFGTIESDSKVTLIRLSCDDAQLEGCPEWLADLLESARQHINRHRCVWRLVKGHPTRAMLLAGYSPKGRPVSVWNDTCDKLCKAALRELEKDDPHDRPR